MKEQFNVLIGALFIGAMFTTFWLVPLWGAAYEIGGDLFAGVAFLSSTSLIGGIVYAFLRRSK
ncbi:MAG TPA: hypothetical protein VNT58_09480 [Gaiellaceae bacterium]|nr:hypothetical protein [Gaiellaceae bacterium]